MADDTATDWPHTIYRLLSDAQVRNISYVLDGGHKQLIQCCSEDAQMRTISLATEQEGIGLAAGAWLGGIRSALLMQSSVWTTASMLFRSSATAGFHF